MPRNFRTRRQSSSDEESNNENSNENVKEKIEELKLLHKTRQRVHGIDSYALATGEQEPSTLKSIAPDDPWKSRTGGLVDMKKILEKRGNEIVKNMHSNFARETNQRDEDAEMQKFIEEQLRLKKEAERLENASKEGRDGTDTSVYKETEDGDQVSLAKKYRKPEDALFDVPKYLIESQSKHKSEESLSEQMLSGIPEVDLGVEERMRNIEETERAKQMLLQKNRFAKSGGSGSHSKKTEDSDSQYAPQNLSVNFVQHKRFDDTLINPDHMVKLRFPKNNAANQKQESQPVVGDAPKHELLTQKYVAPSFKQRSNRGGHTHHRHRHYTATNSNKPTSSTQEGAEDTATTSNSGDSQTKNKQNGGHKRQLVERATDDYCLERFRKNMRYGRSKIKIA